MKRITAIILTFILLLGSFPLSIYAEEEPNKWEVVFTPNPNTTTATLQLTNITQIGADADSIKVSAAMYYNDTATRQVEQSFDLASYSDDGFVMDFKDYGKFTVTVSFLLNGNAVQENDAVTVGIYADTYNIAPLVATFPVTYFSLSLWGEGNIRENAATIVWLQRADAYDWNSLPEGVYLLPYLSSENMEGIQSAPYSMLQEYVKNLKEINPKSKFNIYCNDMWAPNILLPTIFANSIDNYTITLLTDGTATYSIFSDLYNGTDNEAIHSEVLKEWNDAKEKTIANGKVETLPRHVKDYYWAILDSEPNAQLWLARKALLTTPNDADAFGAKARGDEYANKVIQKNIADMLKNNIASSETNTEEFKALYNFNDNYFEEAQKQGKDVMMFLGTRANAEPNFEEYASFTMDHYGEDYVYYYKGHPATPTELFPDKQAQLDKLGITDVNASIAAELILFFNPDIYLAGYSSSTYQSVPKGHAKVMFNMSKEAGMANPQYNELGVEGFMTMIGEESSDEIKELADQEHSCVLVEFSDEMIEEKNYEIAVHDSNSKTTTYHKRYNVVISDEIEKDTVTVDKTNPYNGATVTITTSKEDMELQAIDPTGKDVVIDNNTFIMPESDVTIQLKDTEEPEQPVSITINITQPTGGTITVKANGKEVANGDQVPSGSAIELTCEPKSGYSFTEWTSPEGVNDNKAAATTYSIDGSTDSVTVSAKLTKSSSDGSSSGSGGGSSMTSDSNQIAISDQIKNGKVTTNKSRAAAGDTITISLTPDEGYKADSVKVTDKNGKEITVTDNGDGTYSFKMPSNTVTVAASFTEIAAENGMQFSDVDKNAYYYEPVLWGIEKSITEGTDATHFSPEKICTRAQMVTFLWRAAGQPEPTKKDHPFTDVPEDAYYTKAVMWAVENGITDGVTPTTFAPDSIVSRAQCVTFLYRFCGEKTEGELSFTDLDTNSYYYEAVIWAAVKGITEGKSSTIFAPEDPCTRGQIITFLYRAFASK